MENIENIIFDIKNENDFENIALKIFHYQAENCQVYAKYIYNLGIDSRRIKRIEKIPFLPIEFFKTHKIISDNFLPEIIFSSSGTTGLATSKHYVKKKNLYEKSFIRSFEMFYGNIDDYCILALLPSYLERKGSSLIYMVEKLISLTNNTNSSFFLKNHDDLFKILINNEKKKIKTLLIGVSFALLDFTENYKISVKNTIVMETGGMKGRREELVREELHNILKSNFNIKAINSEYGMTELLSQSYSFGNGIYNTPPWMKVVIRDTYDPFSVNLFNKSGGINIIDLANIYSCSFIETKDIGRQFKDGSFAILGRFDNSDIRGCNLMTL